MKWFKDVNTIEELRKQYRTLLKKYHPDMQGGSLEATQEINNEYDALFTDFSKEDKEGWNPYTPEENERFKAILKEIISFNMEIEVIGSWIWCFDSYGYKDRLKELGFKYAGKKKAWVWHDAPYRRHHKEEIPIEEIRSRYGGQVIRQRRKQSALKSGS